jgi:hypothetical protein
MKNAQSSSFSDVSLEINNHVEEDGSGDENEGDEMDDGEMLCMIDTQN